MDFRRWRALSRRGPADATADDRQFSGGQERAIGSSGLKRPDDSARCRFTQFHLCAVLGPCGGLGHALFLPLRAEGCATLFDVAYGTKGCLAKKRARGFRLRGRLSAAARSK